MGRQDCGTPHHRSLSLQLPFSLAQQMQRVTRPFYRYRTVFLLHCAWAYQKCPSLHVKSLFYLQLPL